MIRTCLAIVVLGWSLTGDVSGADDPKSVLRRAIDAMGGEAKLAAAQASAAQVKGIMHELDGATFTGSVMAQPPDRFKLSLEIDLKPQKITTTQVLDGNQAWMRFEGEPEEVDATRLTSMKISAYVDHVSGLIALLKEEGYELSSFQPAGKGVGVLVKSKGRPDVKLTFDADTGLLASVEHRRFDPEKKKEVLRFETLADYREAEDSTADERTLQSAKVGVDDQSLLAVFRKGTLDRARIAQIQGLVEKLGDGSFDVREKAKEDLIAVGRDAQPFLKQAAGSPDPEISKRAKACLQKLSTGTDPAIPMAAARLLARRRPAGATAALLAYVPTAATKEVAEEVWAALKVLALRDGQRDKTLVEALKDSDRQKRAAAAFALGEGGDPNAPERVLLFGVKRAMKGAQFKDGQKEIEWEVLSIRLFNRLDDKLFVKPD